MGCGCDSHTPLFTVDYRIR
jgi:hypothetical protein